MPKANNQFTNPFTINEVELIKEKFGKYPLKEIAILMNHPVNSIVEKAYSLGLKNDWWINQLTVDLSKLRDAEKGYIAGIIDGEGSIELVKVKKKNGYKLGFSLDTILMIGNTSKELVMYLHSILGGKRILMTDLPDKTNIRKKAFYIVKIGRKTDILNILELVYPFLIVKKERAKMVMEFCRSRLQHRINDPYNSRELEIYEQMKTLNEGRGRGYA